MVTRGLKKERYSRSSKLIRKKRLLSLQRSQASLRTRVNSPLASIYSKETNQLYRILMLRFKRAIKEY
jgi:hypothetical protein